MKIFAIDPSFTGTGVSLTIDGEIIDCRQFEKVLTDSVYQINVGLAAARMVAANFKDFIEEYYDASSEDPTYFVIEYPILSTRSGAYLGLITSKLDSMLGKYKNARVFYVPAIACKSYTKTNSKTDLVNWVKQNIQNSKGMFKGHDQATALVLTEICKCTLNKTYKHTYFEKDGKETKRS